MIRSTTPSWPASSASSSRPPPATSASAPTGRPAPSAASRATVGSTAFECSAAEEPRSTIALPDLRQRAAASIVTFGLASYTTATTPSGTRTLRISRPLANRRPSMTSPTGSGRATMSRTPRAIAAIRAASSARRSISAAESPASRPASRSRALASRMSPVRRSSASATASSARSLVAESRVASSRAAARAARHSSVTDWVATAMMRVYGRGGRRSPAQLRTK